MAPMADESTSLLGSELIGKKSNTLTPSAEQDVSQNDLQNDDPRLPLFLFLEAKTPGGLKYESFTIFLIFLSVATFIMSSVFLPEYNNESPLATQCDKWCDAIWFGNYPDNALAGLGIGATSIVEIFVVAVFTVDYILRFYTADLIDPKFKGFVGRLSFIPTFFSLVDLSSTVPFFVDAFLLPDTDLAASTFLRMFRLLRMMKVEGRFDLALGMIDDVFYAQRGVLGTALFVGITVWGVLSSFFYIAERKNPDMIYCGAAPDRCFENQDDIDTSLCTMDEWGIIDCSAAGCESGENGQEVCWNLYRSIVDSSFWTLVNLFGEFALVDQHSAWGQVLGTFTAVFAVAVFALPVGVVASGFEDQIARRREDKKRESEANSFVDKEEEVQEDEDDDVVGDASTLRGFLYNFLHNEDSVMAKRFMYTTNTLIFGCAIAFMFDTVAEISGGWHKFLSWFQFFSFLIFTMEYILRMYSSTEHPKHRGHGGCMRYALSFIQLVDLLSIFPYWVGIATVGGSGPGLFLLLKILHFEKHSKAFTTFDDVIRENIDVLAVTGFSAMLLWIFFSSILYFTERDNVDEEMHAYYNTIPNSMWITLLNLSGECPLAHYSAIGKVIVGIIGLFATAVFGVPIGILGAGFEELVTSEYDDSPDEDTDNNDSTTLNHGFGGIQTSCYQFVNGIGSKAATVFELSIYFLIAATVTIGVVQTVDGYEDWLGGVEWVAVLIFTVEYIIRFIGAGADPDFSKGSNGFMARVKYLFSFYSIIDLLAIVPFYIAYFMPNSWIDAHDEYFRMMRLFRLLKLDKYVPSISLVDDVFRLKKNVLIVACYAAITLWVLFTAAMHIVEKDDDAMEIDNLPLYGCVEGCHMSDRYRNFFSSFTLTGIHMTGDFPLIEYGGLARVLLFFMVIAAVGVVSIPSGVIASGFAEIVQTKTKDKSNDNVKGVAGDDWYDIQYRQLKGQAPPLSIFGPGVDKLQFKVKEYLDGSPDEGTGKATRTQFSAIGRLLFFLLIIANVVAVIFESIPEVDKFIGNKSGNFFDVFEAWSVFFFTVDYALRLFSARKSREALFSPWTYATTFFGLVDLVSIFPWYIQFVLARTGHLNGDEAKVFRIFRIFRVLQLEDFVIAFSKLDNVVRASMDVLKATGLMAVIIWVGTAALFFIFEENNPNFRQCDGIPLVGTESEPGCYDFESTAACNEVYPDRCSQTVFTNMPNALFMVAVFLGGEWGVVDFTWQGKLVCMFLCVAGIAIYSIPVGTLFDSFGAVVGLSEDEEEEEKDEKPVVKYN